MISQRSIKPIPIYRMSNRKSSRLSPEPSVTSAVDCFSDLPSILENAPNFVCNFDAKSDFISRNSAARPLLGHIHEEILVQPAFDYIHADDYQPVHETIAESVCDRVQEFGPSS